MPLDVMKGVTHVHTRGRKKHLLHAVRFAGCLGLVVGAALILAVPDRAAGTQSAATAGENACAECHTDTAKAFARNPHSALGEAACASCHTGADKHIAEGGGDTLFAFKATDKPAEKIKACLACHSGSNAQFMASPHGKASLDCTSCHSVHSSGPEKHLLNAGTERACYSCHQDVFAKFDMNVRHKLQEGILECTTCHNPHVPATNDRLGGFKQEACLKCHTDKGGPFLYEHGASRIEGCTVCHDTHGSPNRHMLFSQSVSDLCFSCHTFAPQWHSGFGEKTTNCVSCHTTIHGSNMSRIFIK
jgi:DmsE family decaheme c-type cytochrome